MYVYDTHTAIKSINLCMEMLKLGLTHPELKFSIKH